MKNNFQHKLTVRVDNEHFNMIQEHIEKHEIKQSQSQAVRELLDELKELRKLKREEQFMEKITLLI
ncbi:hypothetical protein [Bacillus salipaludis]|uniref:hypothetical protein n=1 Tax=Bacillus salipaludis TaxID=2547811 RepID=UPI002E1FE9AD|nr:hypothetical protein [Bacillus salipaludis]